VVKKKKNVIKKNYKNEHINYCKTNTSLWRVENEYPMYLLNQPQRIVSDIDSAYIITVYISVNIINHIFIYCSLTGHFIR
jgi:hypothetical protein